MSESKTTSHLCGRLAARMFIWALAAALGCNNGGAGNASGRAGGRRPPATRSAKQGWPLYEAAYRDLALERASGMVDAPPRVELTEDGRVLYHDPNGQLLWTKRPGGSLGSVRPPDRVVHRGHVFVVRHPGIVALDAADGNVAWTCDEPAYSLLARGDLLLAVNCAYDAPEKRWLVARRVTDGKVVWRAPIPKHKDPQAIELVGEYSVVRSGAIKEGHSQVIDPRGRTVLELDDECIYSGRSVDAGGDLILLTSKRILRFRPSEKRILWQIDGSEGNFWPFDTMRSIRLRSGDLLVYQFGLISDSGVRLRRVGPSDGTVRWTAACNSLGVMHSAYYHCVYVKELGDELLVVSRGSRYFVELRDLTTGAPRRRLEFRRPTSSLTHR